MQADWDEIDRISRKFRDHGADVYYVELEATLDERLRRNRTEHRLQEKPTKRNLEWSENDLLKSARNYRLNSLPGEIPFENYLRLDNTSLSPSEAADQIVDAFGLRKG